MAWLPADNKSGLLAGINLINTVGSSKFISALSQTYKMANISSLARVVQLGHSQLCRALKENHDERDSADVVLPREHHWA